MTSLEETTTILQRTLWVLNTLFHKLLAIVTFLILWILFINNSTSSKILWHAFWSTIAYIPLMAEGLVLFSESNSWTLNLRRNIKHYVHSILLVAGVVTVTVGILLDYQSKEDRHAKHFTSKHGKLGFASWILCFITSAIGVPAFFPQILKKLIPQVYVKFLHNITGLAAYTTGIASLIYGLDYGVFSRHISLTNYNALLYCIYIATVYSVLEALRSMYYQIKSLF